jgi:hypothetical protein
MLKNHDAAFVFKDGYDMKSENKPTLLETMNSLG